MVIRQCGDTGVLRLSMCLMVLDNGTAVHVLGAIGNSVPSGRTRSSLTILLRPQSAHVSTRLFI